MTDRFAAYQAALRKGGFWRRCYMSVYRPDPVAEFTLSATPVSGAVTLAGAYTVGSESLITNGFYLRFYDGTTGDFKGDSRVRYSGSMTSASIPVRELPYGHAKLTSGDVVRIYPYVPLDTRLVEASAAFNPDGEPYSDEGLSPSPNVTFGGHWAGRVDTNSGIAQVYAKGSLSTLVDPTSTTPVTHFTATLPTGVTYHSGSTNSDADPVFDVQPGQYLIRHVGTDPDNGRVGFNNVIYMAHDDSNPPYEVLLPTPPTGDPLNGWTWTAELFDHTALEELWDGGFVILWADEFLGGVQQSFRSALTNRSHMLGMGYVRRDTSSGDSDGGDRMIVEIQSPLARLSEIASYSNVKQEAPTPDEWADVNTLTVLRGIYSLKTNYTPIQEAGYDFIVHPLVVDARYPKVYLDRSDAISQIRDLASSRKARLTNPERGARFELQPELYALNMTDRASLTTTYTFTADDVFSYELKREHQDGIEIFELQGITGGASGNTSVFSRFPGLSPAGGKSYVTQGKYIPDSQASQNADCALIGAFKQQVFIDEVHSNRKDRVGELTLRTPGQYGFLDWSCEWVKFDYQGSKRGIDYLNFRYWLKRVQMNVDEQTGEWIQEAVFQQETGAPADAAMTYVPSNPNTVAPPVITPPPPPIVTPITTGNTGLTIAPPFLYAPDSTNNVVWTWTRDTRAWAQTINLTTLGLGGTLLSALWRPGGNIMRLLTTTETRLLNNYSSGTPALGTAHTFPETAGGRQFQSERGVIDFVAIVTYIVGTGYRVDWSPDNLVTVHRVSPGGDFNNVDTNAANHPFSGVFVDPHIPGHWLISVFTNTATTSSLTAVVKESFDYGATWATYTATAQTLGHWTANMLVVGYLDVGASNIYHGESFTTGSTDFRFYRNNVDISPEYPAGSGTRFGYLQGENRCCSVADDSPDTVFLCAAAVANSATVGFAVTHNKGASWTWIVTPSSSFYGRRVYAVSATYAIVVGINGYVAIWDGSVLIDISIPSGGNIPAIMGA